jgi:hypothetical protein
MFFFCDYLTKIMMIYFMLKREYEREGRTGRGGERREFNNFPLSHLTDIGSFWLF